jgi:hypothetical protein
MLERAPCKALQTAVDTSRGYVRIHLTKEARATTRPATEGKSHAASSQDQKKDFVRVNPLVAAASQPPGPEARANDNENFSTTIFQYRIDPLLSHIISLS